MWVLEILKLDGGVETTLPAVAGTYSLGRKDGSVAFADDRSVSRRHAEVRVGLVPGGDSRKQPIGIKDVGSKFKTFVNDIETGEVNKEISLKEGDVVKVGHTRSLRVSFRSLHLCGTRLSREASSELKVLAAKVGGTIAKKWDADCTHLICPDTASIVTEKLVLALAEARPAIHVGWLKALIADAAAHPIRPVPDTSRFPATIKRGGATVVVREDMARRSHLGEIFFVLLHKDEAFERIAEGTGALLCRCAGNKGCTCDSFCPEFYISPAVEPIGHIYRWAMDRAFQGCGIEMDPDSYQHGLESDVAATTLGSISVTHTFYISDWETLVAGRTAFHVQPLHTDTNVSSPNVAAVIDARGKRLTKLGMEATTKSQLAEAVVYMQAMMSLKEAEAASQNGGEMMGLSQAFASQQVSQHTPRTVIALPNTTAPSTTKPSPPRSLPVLLPSSWPSSSPSSSSSKTNHHPEAIGTTARVSLEADAKASAAVATTTIITDASHIRAGAKSPSPAAARATDEVVITVSRSFNPPASRSPGNKDAIIAALPNAVVGDAQEGGNDDDEVAVLGGRDVAAPPQGGVVSLKGGKSASRMSGPRDGGREKRRRRVVEGEVDERAVRGGEEIGEDGGTRRGEEEGHGMEAEEWQPLAKRKRGGASSAENMKDRKRPLAEHTAEEKNNANEKQKQLQPQQEDEHAATATATAARKRQEEISPFPSGVGSCGKRGRSAAVVPIAAAAPTSPTPEQQKKQTSSCLQKKAKPSVSTPSQREECVTDQGGDISQPCPAAPSPPPSSSGDGWMTAFNAASAKDTGKSGGKKDRGGGGEGGEEAAAEVAVMEEDEEEIAPLEAAITESCRLVARVYSVATQNSAALRRRGLGRERPGVSVPNFKHFKKNSIMYGGEGIGEYIPMSALRSTLPKESERELVLAAEQKQLEEEEADAERLFSQEMRGVSKASRGRTRRR